MKNKVATWLRSLPGVTNVEPATVTIGKQTWDGARYTQYDRRHFYLVGDLPKSFLRGPNTSYQLPEDARDWYVACYMAEFDDLEDRFKVFHPFGNHWIMMPAFAIHDGHDQTYRRMKATIS